MLYSFLGVLYILVCFVGWHVLYQDVYKYDHHGADFKCFWFGGQRYRVEYIKKSCERGVDYFNGKKRWLSREEVEKDNLYEEAFWVCYDSRIKFFGTQFLYLLLGPIVVLNVVTQYAISVLIGY